MLHMRKPSLLYIYKSSSTTNIFNFLPTIIFSQVSCRTPRVSTSSLSKKGRFQSSDLQLPTPAFTGSVTGVGSFSAGGCFSTDGIFAPVVPVTGSATLGKDFQGQNPGVFFLEEMPKGRGIPIHSIPNLEIGAEIGDCRSLTADSETSL